MTEDLLERQLTEAMAHRAGGSEPDRPDFADVTRRAGRRRRARASRLAAATALVAVLVLGAVAAASRPDGGVAVTTMPEPAPVGVPVDPVVRWPALVGADPSFEDVAVTTDGGLQQFAEAEDIEVTPYLVLGYPKADHMVLYGLDGTRWTTTTSSIQDGADQAFGTFRLLTGTGFDPTRVDRVPRSTSYYVRSEEDAPALGTSSYANARPEVLLASPERQQVDLPVERLGAFDWVVLPGRCAPGPSLCERTAVGGDEGHLVVVELQTAPGLDLRSILGRVELRAKAALVRPPGITAPLPPGADAKPYQAPNPWKAAPFLIVQTPVGADGWAWPVEITPGYCAAYSLWTDFQELNPEAVGSPGWIRWVEGLDSMAPPELGDAWGVLAAERRAGHDPTTTEPGLSALRTVVTDGATRCPS